MDAQPNNFKSINLDLVVPSPFQARKDFPKDYIAGLAADIKANGLLQPVVVRQVGDKWELICGECRVRALRLLGEKTIVAIVDNNSTDAQAALAAASENIQRQNLRPMEEANAISAAISAGNSIEDIAAAFGRSTGYITRRAFLLNLSPQWKRAVESGFAREYPMSFLVEVARVPEANQKEIYDNYKDGYSEPDGEELRNRIQRNTLEIASAPFDTSLCVSCQNNTLASGDLFDDINPKKGGGRCLDTECWKLRSRLKCILSGAAFFGTNASKKPRTKYRSRSPGQQDNPPTDRVMP